MCAKSKEKHNKCLKEKKKSATLFPNWHELWKQEKNSSLAPPRDNFSKTKPAWQGVKLTWLMSIFTSKNVLEIFDKNSAQNLIFKGQGDKSIPPHTN